ncbi:MAG: hypothetical protein EXS09_18730 [Gemmataceae bacterium]|nr:hypothetical protein [Gemmataceae bacterium]
MNRFTLLFVAVAIIASGCNEVKPSTAPPGEPTKSGDASVQTNLGKLSAEDRKIAVSQKNCPITDEALGTMGVPIKLMINDQPVFICCKSCEKSAKKDLDKTLQKVGELKAQAGKSK